MSDPRVNSLAFQKIYTFIDQNGGIQSLDKNGKDGISWNEVQEYLYDKFDTIFGEDKIEFGKEGGKNDIISAFWNKINTNTSGKQVGLFDFNEQEALQKRIEVEEIFSKYADYSLPSGIDSKYSTTWKLLFAEELRKIINPEAKSLDDALSAFVDNLDGLKEILRNGAERAKVKTTIAVQVEMKKDACKEEYKDLLNQYGYEKLPSDLVNSIDRELAAYLAENEDKELNFNAVEERINKIIEAYFDKSNNNEFNRVRLITDLSKVLLDKILFDGEGDESYNELANFFNSENKDQLFDMLKGFLGTKINKDTFSDYYNYNSIAPEALLQGFVDYYKLNKQDKKANIETVTSNARAGKDVYYDTELTVKTADLAKKDIKEIVKELAKVTGLSEKEIESRINALTDDEYNQKTEAGKTSIINKILDDLQMSDGKYTESGKINLKSILKDKINNDALFDRVWTMIQAENYGLNGEELNNFNDDLEKIKAELLNNGDYKTYIEKLRDLFIKYQQSKVEAAIKKEKCDKIKSDINSAKSAANSITNAYSSILDGQDVLARKTAFTTDPWVQTENNTIYGRYMDKMIELLKNNSAVKTMANAAGVSVETFIQNIVKLAWMNEYASENAGGQYGTAGYLYGDDRKAFLNIVTASVVQLLENAKKYVGNNNPDGIKTYAHFIMNAATPTFLNIEDNNQVWNCRMSWEGGVVDECTDGSDVLSLSTVGNDQEVTSAFKNTMQVLLQKFKQQFKGLVDSGTITAIFRYSQVEAMGTIMSGRDDLTAYGVERRFDRPKTCTLPEFCAQLYYVFSKRIAHYLINGNGFYEPF